MIKIRVKLTIVFCIRLLEASAYGAYRDPIAKTNINPKTDLFEKEIEDYGTFEKAMDALKEQAVNGITSSGTLELISDKTDDELKAAAGDLSSIRATELQAKGREEVLRTGMTELHVDYTNPLNTEHQKDAIRIADSSEMLLGKLMELFKEFGIDCQTVKGNTVIEPEYHIEIKKEQVKDTVYTKTMCEEPRNQYNCHDVLTLKCTRTGPVGGIKYILKVSRGNNGFVDQLLQGARALSYSDKVVLMQLYGWSLPLHLYNQNHFYNPPIGLVADMTPYSSVIKDIISKDINTGKIIVPPHRWYWPEFNWNGFKARHHQMSVQKITGEWYENPIPIHTPYIKLYYYDEQCIEWSEDWSETCILQ